MWFPKRGSRFPAKQRLKRGHIGKKLKGSFYRGSFRKGVAVPNGVPGGGFRVGFRGMAGMVFLLKMREKGKGEGGGGGGDRQRNRQVNAQAFVETTL